jgi:hypothetical protein
MNTLSKEYREKRAAEIKAELAELFAHGLLEAERASKAHGIERDQLAAQFGIQHEGLPTATMPLLERCNLPSCSVCGNQSAGTPEDAVSPTEAIRKELAESKRRESKLQAELERCYPLIRHWAKEAHTLQARVKTLEDALEHQPIIREILNIMQTYHEQDGTYDGVATPGGLEHMGDVWRLFLKWEKQALAAKEPKS